MRKLLTPLLAAVLGGSAFVAGSTLMPGDSFACQPGFRQQEASDAHSDTHVVACESPFVVAYFDPGGAFRNAWLTKEGRMTEDLSEVPGWVR